MLGGVSETRRVSCAIHKCSWQFWSQQPKGGNNPHDHRPTVKECITVCGPLARLTELSHEQGPHAMVRLHLKNTMRATEDAEERVLQECIPVKAQSSQTQTRED